VSARRGPVLWSHVLDVRSHDCPFVAALLALEAFDRSLVIDMSTTQSCRNTSDIAVRLQRTPNRNV